MRALRKMRAMMNRMGQMNCMAREAGAWLFFALFMGAIVCSVMLQQVAEAYIEDRFEVEARLSEATSSSLHPQGYPYQKFFESSCSKYGVPLPIAIAVARGESFFAADARSPKGAIGVMQVMSQTGRQYGYKPIELYEPQKNIDAGVHYLADLYKDFNQDMFKALAAYYCGPNRIKGAETMPEECQEYVFYIDTHLQKVMKFAEKRQPEKTIARNKFFTVATFDFIINAKNYIKILSEKLPALEIDLKREEKTKDGRFSLKYHVIAWFVHEDEQTSICKNINRVTGFAMCGAKEEEKK